LSVQWVIRPYSTEHHDYRGLAGRLTGGTLAIGDRVRVLPGAQQSTVIGIDRGGVPQETAEPGEAISIQLADDIDISRGDVMVTVAAPKPPVVADQIVADVSWMVDKPLEVGSRWIIKHLTRTAKAFVSAIETRHDVVTAAQHSTERLELNDLGRVHLNVSVPLVVDLYDDHRPGGAAILVDEATGMTCAALMIRGFDE
jgi:sulfate adenylyltransferase subunit 1 (EFTu-like GTPase family)